MADAVELLIIDPQNDFCDLPHGSGPLVFEAEERATPSLPVPGAHEDMRRIARFIRAAEKQLTGITVTLDTHQRLDIAHTTFWQMRDGGHVAPFTAIGAAQVRAGEYRPKDPSCLERALAYLDELEARERYRLVAWPVHCELGAWGSSVHPEVRAAYNHWEETHVATVRRVTKGENPWTEHYSALLAEVPIAGAPETQLNRELMTVFDRTQTLFVAGEAGSHCVRATCEDLVMNLENQNRERMNRIVLLTDCMSPVPGFEAHQAAFLSDMQQRGLQLLSSVDALATLIDQ